MLQFNLQQLVELCIGACRSLSPEPPSCLLDNCWPADPECGIFSGGWSVHFHLGRAENVQETSACVRGSGHSKRLAMLLVLLKCYRFGPPPHRIANNFSAPIRVC